MNKELIFSVTKDDCEWEFFTAGGKGGQHQNKTASACRCKHPPSGAEGISRDQRSQWQNKQLAFERMGNSKEFQTWARLQASKQLAIFDDIHKTVDKMMDPDNLRIEIMIDGKWTEVSMEYFNKLQKEQENENKTI